MNQEFTGIQRVLVTAQCSWVFQCKMLELADMLKLASRKTKQGEVVINGVRFIYVNHPQQIRGYDVATTRYLDFWGAWQKYDLFEALTGRYQKLSSHEFYLITEQL